MKKDKYIKITCPCKREHLKTYDADKKYLEEECSTQMGFIGEDNRGTLAYYCTYCKRVLDVTVEEDIISINVWEKGEKIQTTSKTVVIYDS